ncbi:S1 RNA-binding domain-containing protein [Ferrimonas sp. SCSIO 43195]|uniref:CvfB family protein n=1 Tax=Ferrimonas sp. SCSIO 43195 TaxID=2822844 RepID=UPI00207562F3|nr:S1-like domain-containing RNA-binding protein [Ferrimonas sp. SCSIO 43195]
MATSTAHIPHQFDIISAILAQIFLPATPPLAERGPSLAGHTDAARLWHYSDSYITMVKIGQYNRLKVVRLSDYGVFLDGDSFGNILLPNKFVPEGAAVGTEIEVFIYFDSNDQLIATTQKAKACLGEFALLQVVDINNAGAFMDWGLDKDLLVPYNQQKVPMEKGRHYVVYVYQDRHTERLAASSKLDRFVSERPGRFRKMQEVDLMLTNNTDLGFKAIVNDSYWGILYHNELFKDARVGQRMKGYVKWVREDGGIDLTLNPPVNEALDQLSQQVLDHLQRNNGFSPLGDKADPEAIKRLYKVSKKMYKRTIGGLFKSGRISIDSDGIRLKEKQ